jgi:hypothetical protein
MILKLSAAVATVGFLCVERTEAWLSPGLAKTRATTTPKGRQLESTSRQDDHLDATTTASSRRQWILKTLQGGGAMATAASLIAWQFHPSPSWASGGATAGGVYLLSAKQRYNERVKAGVKGFAALRPLVEAGNVDGIRSYFASEDVGSWKDLSTAGYLLANAFRRNSSAAPDSLPSVQVRACVWRFEVLCFVLFLTGYGSFSRWSSFTLTLTFDFVTPWCVYRSGRRLRERSKR